MKQINLTKRLRAIADCIDEGASVADIGTDHGYLAVYLAQKSHAASPYKPLRIIASDSSAGSLESARRSASKYDVSDAIEFVCSPGLDHIGKSDVDIVVIAGVGGETILGILDNAPWTIDASSEGHLKLILQPQTKLDVLKDFLHNRGYPQAAESTVTDRGRIYTILVI